MVGLERLFVKAGHTIASSATCQKGLTTAAVNFFNKQQPLLFSLNLARCNSTRATICRVNRLQFMRQYPTKVVNSDGSTFTIRYHEPRHIIKLPVDISLLSDAERNKHLERRKPKTKVNLDEEFEDDTAFDSSKYLNLVKKK